jgi:[protein-PII] uridylyltransferase
VRYHLLMSDMAQKRDIGDPRTVRDFRQGGEDAQAAGPADGADGLRHPRRGAGHLEQLEGHAAAQLYRETAEALEGGLESVNRESRARTRPSAPCARAGRLGPPRIRKPNSRATTAPYWQGLSTDTQAVFANLLRGLGDDEIRIDLHPDPDRDATRACLCAGRPSGHLFAPGGGAGAGGRERGGRADLYVQGRLRDGRVLGAGRRGRAL